MRWLLAIAMLLLLAGCGPSKRQDMAACTVEATKVYPHLNADDHVRGEAADFEYECMVAKGYVWEDKKSICPTITDSGDHFTETREFCYRKPWPLE